MSATYFSDGAAGIYISDPTFQILCMDSHLVQVVHYFFQCRTGNGRFDHVDGRTGRGLCDLEVDNRRSKQWRAVAGGRPWQVAYLCLRSCLSTLDSIGVCHR